MFSSLGGCGRPVSTTTRMKGTTKLLITESLLPWSLFSQIWPFFIRCKKLKKKKKRNRYKQNVNCLEKSINAGHSNWRKLMKHVQVIRVLHHYAHNRPFPHSAPVNKHKEMRSRLGCTISHKSLECGKGLLRL